MGFTDRLRHAVAMPLFLVAFPTLSDPDFAWIQAVRARHDAERHALIEPHITLVFGTTALSPSALAAHVKSRLRRLPPIALNFRAAQAVKDPLSDNTQVYLVPDEGRDALTALHDRLYRGPLAPALRRDIPYVPHITIVTSHDAAACRTLTDELNKQRLDIAGTVHALDVIALENGRVRQLATIGLGRG